MLAAQRADKARVNTIANEANDMDIEQGTKQYRSLLTGDGNKDRERTKVNLALEANLLGLEGRKADALQRLANGTGSQEEVDGLEELKQRFIEKAKEAYDAVGTGFSDVINTAFSNLGLADAIKKGIDDKATLDSIFKQLGQNIFQSFADSFLKSAEKGLGDLVSNLLRDIIGRSVSGTPAAGGAGGDAAGGFFTTLIGSILGGGGEGAAAKAGIVIPHGSRGGQMGADGQFDSLPSYMMGNRTDISDRLSQQLSPGNQEPSGASQLAVINRGELVIPAAMSREFLNSRNDANRAISSVNTSNQSNVSNQSTSNVTYNNTSNYQPAVTDNFGTPRQVIDRDSVNRGRFER
jgi:hypothetical protein